MLPWATVEWVPQQSSIGILPVTRGAATPIRAGSLCYLGRHGYPLGFRCKESYTNYMVGVLVIFDLIGWLFLTFLQWLSTLSVFLAMVGAVLLCPILAALDYSRLARTWKLRAILSKRDPIPPERFYWTIQRSRLRRMIILFSILSALAWCNAATLPASLNIDLASIAGWLNALAGMLTLSRVISATTLLFKASQRFDAMSPHLVGLLRRAMYKLSDNYEYLGHKKRDPEKEEVY
jgi:hypothetical protein